MDLETEYDTRCQTQLLPRPAFLALAGPSAASMKKEDAVECGQTGSAESTAVMSPTVTFLIHLGLKTCFL
jgi:hypothetical protein